MGDNKADVVIFGGATQSMFYILMPLAPVGTLLGLTVAPATLAFDGLVGLGSLVSYPFRAAKVKKQNQAM